MRVWLLDLLCPTATKGWNGNLQIVCFYGTFFNVVVPGNGHSRCSFLWHAMCIRPPLKLGHTEHRAHTLIIPCFTNFLFLQCFLERDKRRKKFHQDLNHSYTNLPSPKKYYGLEQNFGQRRTSSSSS